MPYALTRRRGVEHPYRGVAARGVDLDDPVQRAHAIGLVLPEVGAISHSTAALVRGLPLPRALQTVVPVHVSVPRSRRAPRIRGVRGHSIDLPDGRLTNLLVVASSTRELLPVRLVDEALTLLTCATQLALPDLVALADAMVLRSARSGRGDPMLEALELGVGRPGHARLVRAAPLRRAGVRSRAETLLRLMVVSARLPEPDVAHPVASTEKSDERWTAEADLAWPEWGVLLEYEGDAHRTSRRRFVTDVRRFERYADEGWRAMRATRLDVFENPNDLMRRVERRLREGGWRPHRGWRLREVAPAFV